MTVLRFDIAEPKPLDQMTEAELRVFAAEVASVENQLREYAIRMYTWLIQREAERLMATAPMRAAQRVAKPAAKSVLSDNDWRKLMMESDDDE